MTWTVALQSVYDGCQVKYLFPLVHVKYKWSVCQLTCPSIGMHAFLVSLTHPV